MNMPEDNIFETVEGSPAYKPKTSPEVLKRFNEFIEVGRRNGLLPLYRSLKASGNPQELADIWATTMEFTQSTMGFDPLEQKMLEALKEGLLNDEIAAIMGNA